YIKCGLCELLKFWDRMIIDVQEVEFEKRLLIHLVWCVQVSEELIDLAIGQDGYPGIRDMEVAEQLTGVIDIERFADFLAFDEYLDFAVFQDGIVDLLAFLGTNICGEFRNNLEWIEHVVPHNRLDERHDECSLGRFFCLDGRFLLPNLGGQTGQLLFKLHGSLPWDFPSANIAEQWAHRFFASASYWRIKAYRPNAITVQISRPLTQRFGDCFSAEQTYNCVGNCP